jgi:hypothetical protein
VRGGTAFATTHVRRCAPVPLRAMVAAWIEPLFEAIRQCQLASWGGGDEHKGHAWMAWVRPLAVENWPDLYG